MEVLNYEHSKFKGNFSKTILSVNQIAPKACFPGSRRERPALQSIKGM